MIQQGGSMTRRIKSGCLAIVCYCSLSTTTTSAWMTSLNPSQSQNVRFWPCSTTSQPRQRPRGRSCAASTTSSGADRQSEVEKLWEWADLQECEGLENCQVRRNSATGIRGLFAVDSAFEAGDYVLAVPFTATLLIRDTSAQEDRLPLQQDQLPHVDSDVFEGYTFWKNVCCDATSEQIWTPFIDSLPKVNDQNFDPTPEFWSEEQIQQLQIPRLIEESIRRKKQVASLALATGTTVQDLQWATWIVRSRGFTTLRLHSSQDEDQEDSHESAVQSRTFLIPIIDMVNHSEDPNTELEVLEVPGAYDESLFALRAIRTIHKGDELTISYGTGHETSLDLFSRYGFWMNENHADANFDWTAVNPPWTTSLNDDQELVAREDLDDALRTALKLRIHLKVLQESEHTHAFLS